jgi:hypothetical protein
MDPANPGGDDLKTAIEDHLEEAAAPFDKGGPAGQRVGIRIALMGLSDVLLNAGVPFERLRPINAAVQALAEVDAGHKPALFQPETSAGRKPVPDADLHQRGVAAAIMQFYHQWGGMDLEAAAKKAAKAIAGWSRLPKMRKRELWGAIKTWRERAMSGDRNKDTDAERYRFLLDLAEKTGTEFDLKEAVQAAVALGRLHG